MLLPGTDPVSMLIELVPLLLLFEASLLLARAFGRPPDEAAEREIAVSEPPPSGAA
jgi:Sec-independent protein secretion pathway component TatC